MAGHSPVGAGGVGSAPRVEPISGRASELLQRDTVIAWPPLPPAVEAIGHPGHASQIHDPRIEALRARLGKRMLYVACDPESEGDGPLIKFAQYINQVIELRNDLSYEEESMALTHELGHVVLHPVRGKIEDLTPAEFDQEERVLQVVGLQIAEHLELGDHRAFAQRVGFTHFDPDGLTADERNLANRITDEVVTMIEGLEPRVADDIYAGWKAEAHVYVRADDE